MMVDPISWCSGVILRISSLKSDGYGYQSLNDDMRWYDCIVIFEARTSLPSLSLFILDIQQPTASCRTQQRDGITKQTSYCRMIGLPLAVRDPDSTDCAFAIGIVVRMR